MTAAVNWGTAPAAPVALADLTATWRWAASVCRRDLARCVERGSITPAEADRRIRNLETVGPALAALPDWRALILEIGPDTVTPEEHTLFTALGPMPGAALTD